MSDVLDEQRRASDRTLDRRAVMAAAAGVLATGAFGRRAHAQAPVGDRMLGSSGTASAPAPRRRPNFEKDLAHLVDLDGSHQGMAYWRQTDYLTPLDQFFVRNAGATPRAQSEPRVDQKTWRLKIHGDGIERPLDIGYDDLMKMPSHTVIATLESSGNGRSLFWEQQDMTSVPTEVVGTGWGFSGIGMAEWRIVPMSHILGLVGLKPNAQACLFWSAIEDGTPGSGGSGRPVPINAVRMRGDAIGLAYEMNGHPLLPDHGAPVRALVPGYCGAASTKWLTEIKIASHGFWVPSNVTSNALIGPENRGRLPRPGPSDEYRGVSAAQIRGTPLTWLLPRSFLTQPLMLQKQPKLAHNYPLRAGEAPRIKPGPQTMRGYAWAPQHGLRRVDVRVNGTAWQQVRIIDPVAHRYRWARFEFPFDPLPGRHEIETRVTDNSGAVQPATVPFNEGGYNAWMIPKFMLDAV